jgi:hypothetical protein
MGASVVSFILSEQTNQIDSLQKKKKNLGGTSTN